MKIRWFDNEQITNRPIAIFADMPALLGVLDRVKTDLHTVLWEGIAARNYKRAAHIATYFNAITTITNKAMITFSESLATLDAISSIADQEDLPDRISQEWANESKKIEDLVENFFAIHSFFDHREPFFALIEQIATYMDVLISEKTINSLIDSTTLSFTKKKHVLDRMIAYTQNMITTNAAREHESAPSIDACQSHIFQAWQSGELSYEEYLSLQAEWTFEADIKELEDENLAFLHYLYTKKRALEQTSVWVSGEEHWLMHTS